MGHTIRDDGASLSAQVAFAYLETLAFASGFFGVENLLSQHWFEAGILLVFSPALSVLGFRWRHIEVAAKRSWPSMALVVSVVLLIVVVVMFRDRLGDTGVSTGWLSLIVLTWFGIAYDVASRLQPGKHLPRSAMRKTRGC